MRSSSFESSRPRTYCRTASRREGGRPRARKSDGGAPDARFRRDRAQQRAGKLQLRVQEVRQRARRGERGGKRRRRELQGAGGHRNRLAIRGETAEDDRVGVRIFAKRNHRGAAEICRGGEPHALGRLQPVFSRENEPPRALQALDGQLRESFAEPIEIRIAAAVFIRENKNRPHAWCNDRSRILRGGVRRLRRARRP